MRLYEEKEDRIYKIPEDTKKMTWVFYDKVAKNEARAIKKTLKKVGQSA